MLAWVRGTNGATWALMWDDNPEVQYDGESISRTLRLKPSRGLMLSNPRRPKVSDVAQQWPCWTTHIVRARGPEVPEIYLSWPDRFVAVAQRGRPLTTI